MCSRVRKRRRENRIEDESKIGFFSGPSDTVFISDQLFLYVIGTVVMDDTDTADCNLYLCASGMLRDSEAQNRNQKRAGKEKLEVWTDSILHGIFGYGDLLSGILSGRIVDRYL